MGDIQPYLQLAGPDIVPTVIWTSTVPVISAVHYTRDGGGVRIDREGEAGYRHVHHLMDAEPGAEVTYCVYAGGISSAERSFLSLPRRAADGTSDPFVAVIYGDNRSNPAVHLQVIESIRAGPRPSLVLSTGDLVYSGADSASWHVEFLEPAAMLFDRVPVMLSLGNHDLDLDAPPPYPLAPWWQAHFAFPGDPADTGYARWYSYDAGGVHVIHLDSTEVNNQQQFVWLLGDLLSAAAREADFRVVVFHHPPYSAGGHGGHPTVQRRWSTRFVEFDVDVVFVGHNHFYQRTWPMVDEADVGAPREIRDGVDVFETDQDPIYVVTGGGGAPLYDPQSANYIAISTKQHHHVQLDYEAGRMHCIAINRDGVVLDEFLLEHPTP